jgi:aminoglycoside 3-N-acetyltransferase
VNKIDRKRIADGPKGLGVRKGDCVMLHSSLSSLGIVEGGADAVVEASLDAMGAGEPCSRLPSPRGLGLDVSLWKIATKDVRGTKP